MNETTFTPDEHWDLVQGESFETTLGSLQLDHLRGKPPLANYIINRSPPTGEIQIRHNLMNEGSFIRVNCPESFTETEAKQFVLSHDKRVRRGDFL